MLQDARAAKRGFRILREQNWFREIEENDYVVWCDCGKHFRNNEMAGYLLMELADEKKHGFYSSIKILFLTEDFTIILLK